MSSSSSHYFYSTDSGTEYSAPLMHRSRQKKHKRKQMNDYEAMRRGRDPVVNELLYDPRLDRRIERYKRKKKRREEMAKQLAKMAEHGMSTSSGSELSEPTILQRVGAASNVANWTEAGRIVGGVGGLVAGGFAGERIGEIVGGATGFVVGAVRNIGDIAGPGVFGVSQKIMKNAAVAKRVDKSSMAISGKAKVKRRKTVKVSPYLKKAVSQVIAGKQATGFYRRSFSGMIGVANACSGGTDIEVTSNVYGTTQVSWYIPSSIKAAGQRNFFNSLVQSGLTFDATILNNTDLNFFTPQKIWHAASVLFNNKQEFADPYSTTTNNLSPDFITNTGAPATGDPSNLKIDLKSSNVVLTLRNMSCRTVFVDIYECVSSLKFSDVNPLNEAIALAKNINDGTTAGTGVSSIVQYNDGTAERGNQSGLLWVTEGTVDGLSILKDNGWKWKYKKHSMMMASSEICTHTVQGPSGMLDFQKLWDGNAGYKTKGLKDWSKHLIIATRPDFCLRTSLTDGINRGQRVTPQNSTKPRELFNQIAVEVSETFNIKVPEIAGFVRQVDTVNPQPAQPLNMKRKRIQITNLTNELGENSVTDLVYTSEFNPVASSGSAINQSLLQ